MIQSATVERIQSFPSPLPEGSQLPILLHTHSYTRTRVLSSEDYLQDAHASVFLRSFLFPPNISSFFLLTGPIEFEQSSGNHLFSRISFQSFESSESSADDEKLTYILQNSVGGSYFCQECYVRLHEE